jgi:hypothetical protein
MNSAYIRIYDNIGIGSIVPFDRYVFVFTYLFFRMFDNIQGKFIKAKFLFCVCLMACFQFL